MKRKKHVLWALLTVFILTVMSGGCGGGSSGRTGYRIDIHSLTGTWEPYGGSGAATGGEYDFRIQLSNPPGSVTFDVLNVTEEDAAVDIDSAINWDIYYQNMLFAPAQLGLVGKQRIIFQFFEDYSFRFETADGTTIRAKFTSETTLDVEESGDYEIEESIEDSEDTERPEIGRVGYSVKYTLIKDIPPPDDDEDPTDDEGDEDEI